MAMDAQPLLAKLDQLNAIGVALSREENIDHLLERILRSVIFPEPGQHGNYIFPKFSRV